MAQNTLIMILGMAVVTYLPRILPLLGLKQLVSKPLIRRWLELVPPAVLASLLLPSIFAPEGFLSISLSNTYLLAAVPTILAGWLSKSLPLAIVIGILSMLLINNHFLIF